MRIERRNGSVIAVAKGNWLLERKRELQESLFWDGILSNGGSAQWLLVRTSISFSVSRGFYEKVRMD